MPGLSTVDIIRGESIKFPQLLDSLRGATATMTVLPLSPITALDHFSITLLRTFTNLTSLRIHCVCNDPKLREPCSFQLTDGKILELGDALPHIRTLHFGDPDCSGARSTTFKSLIHLSRTYRNMESLTIRVDFTSIVGGSNRQNYGNTSKGIEARPQMATSRLSTLVIGNSPLPDIARCEWVVALALASIFPSIAVLHSSCTGGMQNRWGEVWDDILVCQKISRIARAGKRHTTHGLVIPPLTRSLQMSP
jgi:hypothetical protein